LDDKTITKKEPQSMMDRIGELDDVISLAEKVSSNVYLLRGQIALSKFKILLAFVGFAFIACLIQGAHPKLGDEGILTLYILELLIALISVNTLWGSYKVLLSSNQDLRLDLRHLVDLLTMTDTTMRLAESKEMPIMRLATFRVRLRRISFS
jgi:hypothetical protein